MSVACNQCNGSGGYVVPGLTPASGYQANEVLNPVPSGGTTALCRQCNGTGVTLACGWG